MGLIKFSRRVIARKAVKYALARRGEFVAFVNGKVDLPLLDETQEEAILTLLVDGSLVALDALLGGELAAADESILSKRALVLNAADFAAENIAHFLGEGFDVPGIPETAEVFVGESIAAFLRDSVIPWALESPLLD